MRESLRNALAGAFILILLNFLGIFARWMSSSNFDTSRLFDKSYMLFPLF